MNRLKKAWLALTDRLEPEIVREQVVERVEVPVFGEPMLASVYRAYDIGPFRIQKPLGIYFTCEQAHSEHPSALVSKVDAIRVGRRYFWIGNIKEIEVAPKPKRPKGSRA
jgi:hypothetical protein